MKSRTMFVITCLFALACESLFGSLSEQHPEYCVTGDGKCQAGTHCDDVMHRCVPDTASDGGSDGGSNPTGSFELMAASLLPLAKVSSGMVSEQGVLYRGDFDGNGLPDIFMMGLTRYTKIMNPSAGPPTITSGGYKNPGQNPEVVAIGKLDSDDKDDIAIALAGSTNYIELILSTAAQPSELVVSQTPRGLAIGDFNGDGKNDLAIGYIDSKIDIHTGNGSGGFTLKSSIPIDLGLASATLVAMAVPDDRKTATGPQSLLYTLRSPDEQLASSRLKIARFDHMLNTSLNEVQLSGVPYDLAVGHFVNAVNFDAVVVIGGDSLDLVRAIDGTQPMRSTANFNAYYIDFRQPNKGKIAVGRMLNGSVAAGLDDLAVLHADGYISIYAGGGAWSGVQAKIANRSLIGEHIVAGRFAVGSQRDDLVTFNDSDEGATLSVARNLGGTSANFLLPYDQRGPGTTHPNRFVLTGSFAAIGSSDFAVAGGGSYKVVLRCNTDGNGGASCPLEQPVSAPIVAATTMSCPGMPTQMVAAFDDKRIALIDLSPSTTGVRIAATAPETVEQLEVGDLNSDGSPDIVARGSTGTLSFLMGSKGQPCLFASNFVAPSVAFANLSLPGSRKVLLGDLDGDGLTDLILGAAAQVVVHTSTAGRPLAGGIYTLTLPADPVDIGLADFRGQGQRELVLALEMSGTTRLSWLKLPSTGTTLTETASTSLPMPTTRLVAADA